jgi:hypothetical protein
MKYLITMTSITYAVKAQNMFKSKGIRCRIVPTPKNVGSGCGYSIEPDTEKDRALRLLKENGIKIKGVYD